MGEGEKTRRGIARLKRKRGGSGRVKQMIDTVKGRWWREGVCVCDESIHHRVNA